MTLLTWLGYGVAACFVLKAIGDLFSILDEYQIAEPSEERDDDFEAIVAQCRCGNSDDDKQN